MELGKLIDKLIEISKDVPCNTDVYIENEELYKKISGIEIEEYGDINIY